jgi:hypothetical protein
MLVDKFADFNVKSDRVQTPPDWNSGVLAIDNFLKELLEGRSKYD